MARVSNPFKTIRLRTFLLWLLVSLIPLTVLLLFVGQDETVTSGISLLWLYALIVLWALWAFKKSHISLKYIFGRVPPFRTLCKLLGLVAALVLFSFGVVLIMSYLFSFVGSNFDQKYWEAYGITNNPKTSTPQLYFLLDAISAVFFAPIFEEFFFRGILFERLATKWGITIGMIVSSLCFGLLHGDFVGAFLFGIVMCLVYIKTHSLFATIFCHFFANLLPSILGYIGSQDNSAATPPTQSEYQILGITGTVFVVIAIPFLFMAFRKLRYKNKIAVLPYLVNKSGK